MRRILTTGNLLLVLMATVSLSTGCDLYFGGEEDDEDVVNWFPDAGTDAEVVVNWPDASGNFWPDAAVTPDADVIGNYFDAAPAIDVNNTFPDAHPPDKDD